MNWAFIFVGVMILLGMIDLGRSVQSGLEYLGNQIRLGWKYETDKKAGEHE